MPQDAKSNPSNGLVERVARIVDRELFASLDNQAGFPPESLERWQDKRTADALSKAREIDALYHQEGVLSSQRGENRSANAILGPTPESADTEAVGSGARDLNAGRSIYSLLASAWFYGGWKAGTGAERQMQAIMEAKGWWPIRDEGALMSMIGRELMQSDKVSIPIGGLSLGVEGDQTASVAESASTALPKSDGGGGH